MERPCPDQKMHEWIGNDYPVYKAVWDRIEKDHKNGVHLEVVAQGVKSLIQTVMYDKYHSFYQELCDRLTGKDYPNGYPKDRTSMEWTRTQMTRAEFDAIDWEDIVRGLNEDLTW